MSQIKIGGVDPFGTTYFFRVKCKGNGAKNGW